MNKFIDYMIPALLGAAIASLVLGLRISSLEDEIMRRAPVAIADPYAVVAALPIGTTEDEMQHVIEGINHRTATLVDEGYIVIKPDAVLSAPHYLEVKMPPTTKEGAGGQ